MGEIKERDYMFDTFRGLLMCSIPLSHFIRVAGHFSAGSLGGIIYITINVFVMQAFVFLSGYFSKNVEKSKKTSFHTFMWPYLLGIPFFYCVRYLILGDANWNLDTPPFALWYLWALFFYRYFSKEWSKIPYILEISLIVYLFAGQIPFLSGTWGLGRMVSYFPFFVMAFQCTGDQLKKLQCLKKWHCWVLGIVLMGASCFLAFCVKQLPVGFYLLKSPACELGIEWYWDIIGRIIILVLAWSWIILMVNILPNKMNYMAYIGMNTMPLYMLHLIVRYLVKVHSINFGILPDNWVVYYGTIFVLVVLCCVVFTSKPVVKGYDFVVEGLWKVFCWILDRCVDLLALLHKPVAAVRDKVLDTISGIGEKK
ncbi:MAG: hypothetical protein IJB73_06430 [Firmicutes bacterium]|nr:hypothetical protein [Bacillota bacterium]